MPPRIIPILGRLRQEISACLTPETIREVCRQVGYTWRERTLGPVQTIYLFLLQILHGNTACQHVVQFGQWLFTATAYCQARMRLPLRVLEALTQGTAETLRRITTRDALWHGHRVWCVDGSSFSMPDTSELQQHFGQPGGQRPGCGFPVAKLLVLFDVATGMLLKAAAAPVRTHQMAKVGVLPPVLQRGDVLLADREFCSYAHLALLRKQGIFAVFRVHQKQLVDFTPDRPMAPRHSRGGHRPKRPHSRWVRALGDLDQIVIWYKPKSKPSWMSQDQFAALPAELEVRELRYRVETPGFRTSTITLVTTLLDAKIYPAAELADLYFRRWQVEVNLKHLKISMKMDVLRCETMAGVTQELMMFALAYNLVRSVMVASAQAQGVSPERISLLDTLRWLTGTEGTNPSQTKVNPKRPGRIEPRAVKRRPKQYALLNKPRQELRKELIKKEVAA